MVTEMEKKRSIALFDIIGLQYRITDSLKNRNSRKLFLPFGVLVYSINRIFNMQKIWKE